jgi:L-iditol 2-dehydrogenase
MKAAVLTGVGSIEIKELPVPVPGADEVLVEVKANGICGTDQHIYHGKPGSASVTPPVILGHELSGVVARTGEGVTSLKAGDRVTIDPNIYCRECSYCRKSSYHLCDRLQAIGVTRNGGMAQYCLVPAANAYVLPDSLTFEEGAMIEPLGCVIHGIQQIRILPGSSVMIIGGGYIGMMMLQMAKMLGAAPVIVSEPDPAKRRTAESLGADDTWDPTDSGLLEEKLARLGGGADIVIECVGLEATMEQAVRWAGKGGQVLLFGVASPDASIRVSPFEIFSKELTIKGSFINPHTHEEAISLVSQVKIKIKPLISHRFGLSDLPTAMKEYGGMKVIKGIIIP